MSPPTPPSILDYRIYLSVSRGDCTADGLDALMAGARPFNLAHDVTGMLLYADGIFLQYLEGPAAGFSRVWERIRGSRLHHGIRVLDEGQVTQRLCLDWAMWCGELPQTARPLFDQTRVAAELDVPRGPSPLDTVRDFWRMAMEDDQRRAQPVQPAQPRQQPRPPDAPDGPCPPDHTGTGHAPPAA